MKIICPDYQTRRKISGNLEASVFEYKKQLDSFTDNTLFVISPFVHIHPVRCLLSNGANKENKNFFIYHSVSLKKIYGNKILLDFFGKFKNHGKITKGDLYFSGLKPIELDILFNEHFIIKKDDNFPFWGTRCPLDVFPNWEFVFDRLHIFISSRIPLWGAPPADRTNLSYEKGKEHLKGFLGEIAYETPFPKITFYTDNSESNWKIFVKLADYLKSGFTNKRPILTLLIPAEVLTEDKTKYLREKNINTSAYLPKEFNKWKKFTGIFKKSQNKMGNLIEFVWNSAPFTRKRGKNVLKFFSKELQAKNVRLNIIQNSAKKIKGKQKADLYLRFFNDCRKAGINENFILNNYNMFFEERAILNSFPVYFIQLSVNPKGEAGFCRPSILNGKFSLGKISELNAGRIFKSGVFAAFKNRTPVFQDKCKNCIAIGLCRGGCLKFCYAGGRKTFKFDAAHCDFMKCVTKHFLDKFVEKI